MKLGESSFQIYNTNSGVPSLNRSSPSYGELASSIKRTVAVGYCTSWTCARYSTSGKVAKELARKNADRCPDCNHFLFYKSSRE